MSSLFFTLLKAVITTIICELIILYINKERRYKIYLFVAIMNIITNVGMNLFLQTLGSQHYYINLLISEIIVFIVETICYFCIYKDIKKAIKLSLICNLFSYYMGYFI